MKIRSMGLALAILTCLVLLPATARAQSQIAGVVKDTSGAVLPGVTVEAASPALIEKVRSVVSDDHGAYLIVDLRPGTYTVTFSLPGFSAFKREGLELPSNFTATINAEMKVGALEETVTVSGASPVVDVKSQANTQVINRDVLDAVPTGRTAQTAAALVPGVVMGTPDVAGSNGMNQNTAFAHGYGASDATVLMDGVQLQGMCGNGSTQSYSNVQNYEEIVITNSGAGADVSGGGVIQNIIPRKGGNDFHANGAAAYASGSWQASATDASLQARGLALGNSFKDIWDAETAFGGKIKKDKLWWYAGTRKNSINNNIAGTVGPDGVSQVVAANSITNASLRLTYQVTPRNQFNIFYDRVWKEEQAYSAGTAYEAGTKTWNSPLYDQGQVKWTSPVTNRLFLEAGFNHYQPNRTNTYEPFCACYNQMYGSPGWYQYVAHRDLSLSTTTVAAALGLTTQDTTRHFYDAAASYITGTHSVKVGIQDQHGYEKFNNANNGSITQQQYNNGVPASAILTNGPNSYFQNLDHYYGLYAQDKYVVKRLSLAYGIRFERVQSSIPAQTKLPGRFAPEGTYNGDVMPTFNGYAPRTGATYDLFGDNKTAIKVSANKYLTGSYDTLTNGFNPMKAVTGTVNWTDSNSDNIVQDSELQLSQLPANFGVVKPGCSVVATPGALACGTSWIDPNRKQGHSWLYNIGVQRQLLPGVAVNANWFHTNFYDLPLAINSLQAGSDYTMVNVVSPLDGSIVPVYNVSAAKQNQVLTLNTTAPSTTKQWVNALEFSGSARLLHGGTVFAGISMDRTTNVACDNTSNPNTLRYCDQSVTGVPWLVNGKAAASLKLPYDIALGIAFQTYKYRNTGTQWQITNKTTYAANCLGPCTPGAVVDPGLTVANISIPLVAPQNEFTDRIKQLDLNVGKWFQIGKTRFQPEVSYFNLLNNLAVYGFRSQLYGTATYLTPTTLTPRTLRFGVQFKI